MFTFYCEIGSCIHKKEKIGSTIQIFSLGTMKLHPLTDVGRLYLHYYIFSICLQGGNMYLPEFPRSKYIIFQSSKSHRFRSGNLNHFTCSAEVTVLTCDINFEHY